MFTIERQLGLVVLLMATAIMSGAWSLTRPDPGPYEVIKDGKEWRSPDGRRLLFCLLGQRGEPRARALAVYEKKGWRWQRIFLDLDRGANPGTIKLAELDGDTLPEVAVGVFKGTRFDPLWKERLFLFDWKDNDTLFPKWLGSRLGLDLVVFAFARGPEGLDRLLTVEAAGKERLVLRQYHWNGFGFTHDRDWVRIWGPEDFETARARLEREMDELAGKGVTR
jgi:hypothetical protein